MTNYDILMQITLTKTDIKTLIIALQSAIQNEQTLLDAHLCQFCHGTKNFNNRPCNCKTGILKGSIGLCKTQAKLISNFEKLKTKLHHFI